MATPDISLFELRNNFEVYESVEFNHILKDSWVLTEFPNRQNSIFDLLFLFKNSKREFLMDKKELIFYNNLPDEVVVYRGIWGYGKIRGLSWTFNKEKARWFSNRFGKGILLRGKIKKSDIFAVFLDRGEEEIVLNPYKLKEVQNE